MDSGYRPFFDAFCRAPALHPAPPFEKGGDPKTFSANRHHTFIGRVKNPECRNNGFPGTDLWTPVAVPSVGVLCFRAWWEASSESPWVFGDASRLHDLKRPSLFRRDEVPARNTNRPSGFAFTNLKKVFGGSKGRFFKNAPWQGVGQRPTKGERASLQGTPFQAGQSPCTKYPQDCPASPLRTEKSF